MNYNKYFEITDLKTQSVIHRIDVSYKSDAEIMKIEDGLYNRVDLENFSIHQHMTTNALPCGDLS